jgi:hypothetical protein
VPWAGALMVAAGFTWFIGNFESSDEPALAWFSQHGKFVCLGVLVHLALVLLEDTIGRRATGVVVAASYVRCLAALLWAETPAAAGRLERAVSGQIREQLHNEIWGQ